MKTVVRVAVNNNFNCTKPEWLQLDMFSSLHPDKTFFVNSNIHTPDLVSISKHNYKAVITANPNILIDDPYVLIHKLKVIQKNVAFVRVKYVPGYTPALDLIDNLSECGFNVVITLQRFNKKFNISKFANPKHYQFTHSRWRLKNPKPIINRAKNSRKHGLNVFICDQAGLGCQGCGLCAKLTTGSSEDVSIKTLNLSTSGLCKFNCPDCYAKTMQKFCIGTGHNPISYDNIHANCKQAGKTKHIQEAKEKRCLKSRQLIL